MIKFHFIYYYYYSYNDQIKYQSEQLLSVLELPILMQTALNNGDYESALDLFTYIRNLSRKYNDLSAVQVDFTYNLYPILWLD